MDLFNLQFNLMRLQVAESTAVYRIVLDQYNRSDIKYRKLGNYWNPDTLDEDAEVMTRNGELYNELNAARTKLVDDILKYETYVVVSPSVLPRGIGNIINGYCE